MIDNIIYENINGVKLAFIQKKDYVNKQAMICFKYGSINNNVVIDDVNIKYPYGIAHFLEHKMFEKEDYNVFETFNKLGGNINAYTNFLSTAYYFDCTTNFYSCFDELLKLVSKPYYTKENVEKEKAIIEQEIKMYDDDAYWRVFFNLMGIMCSENNPLTKDIAGSVLDIRHINHDMLYSCYNNFYTKDNCIIICCGDIEDKKRIEQLILKNLTINDSKCGKIVNYKEIGNNKSKYVNKKMGLNQKIFNIGFKNVEKSDTIFKKIICNKIAMDIFFGKGSDFYDKLYNKNLIDNSFGFDFNALAGQMFYIFSGTSKDEKSIANYICEEAENIKNKNINEKDFCRIKNKHIGNFIKNFNFIDDIVSIEADFFSNDFNIKQYYDFLNSVSIEDVKNSFSYFKNDAYISVIT